MKRLRPFHGRAALDAARRLPPPLRQAAVLALPALLVVLCWMAACRIADQMVAQDMQTAVSAQRLATTTVIDSMAQTIATDLALSRAIPATVSNMQTVQHALDESLAVPLKRGDTTRTRREVLRSRRDLRIVNDFLRQTQGYGGLDTLWIANADGFCIASSNAFDPESFVGQDMSNRQYLREALLGSFSESYGIGRGNGIPGLYLSAPVYDGGGRLVGAVIATVALARLRHWVAHPGTFVADGNGVIIMAHDETLEYRAAPDASVTRMELGERLGTYQREAFRPLTLQPMTQAMAKRAPWVPPPLAAQLVSLDGNPTPALYESKPGLNSALSAYLVDRFAAWKDIERAHARNRLLIFVVMVGSAAFLSLILLSYTRERRLHRSARELAEQLQAANARLSDEARHDALTGALSRRYFLDLLRGEMADAQRFGKRLVVALADLDHFKQINDRYGHACGDRVLAHFLDVCRAELRGGDAVGRLGGEEFGIALPGAELGQAAAVVERLRGRFRDTHLPGMPPEARPTVSIGLAELAHDDTVERLLGRADQALYLAKSLGRDRSITADAAVDGDAPADAMRSPSAASS